MTTVKRQHKYDLEVLYPHPDFDEIGVRLQKRTSIVFTYPDIKYEFRIVSASEARNWDGTPSDWGADDPRKAIEKAVTRDGKTQYSNFWGWN